MNYGETVKGRFLSRRNRFLAEVGIGDGTEAVHVRNTGRLRELLTEGAEVSCVPAGREGRKTAYGLIAVRHAGRWVNIDSAAPNTVAEEWLRSGTLFSPDAVIRREVTKGASRFDFQITDGDRTAYLEVKGCTLVKDGTALFPDAPTERGLRHVRELTEAVKEGFGAFLLFVIQRDDASVFSPNWETQPGFGEALKEARDAGVRILALDCTVTAGTVEIRGELPVRLQ